MKKTALFCIILTILSLCACEKKAEPQAEKMEVLASDFATEKEQEFEDPSIGEVVASYDPKDYQNLRRYGLETAMVADTSPQTIEEILSVVHDGGLIVTGKAYGLRESIDDPLYYGTNTLFEVDHVFYGDVEPGETIIVQEDYLVKEGEKGAYLFSLTKDYSYMQNGEYVLLFLRPALKYEGYGIVHNASPIEEDYLEWSEEYLERFLDYFRGDKTLFDIPETTDATVGGSPVRMYPPGWPKREISNEELIAEMQDNLLFYLATEMKIKIWPTRHVDYAGDHCGRTKSSLKKWQEYEAFEAYRKELE